MGIVDRGSRDERHPRSQWPDKRHWPPRDRPPEPPQQRRLGAPTATYLIMAICIIVFAYGEYAGRARVLIDEYAYLPSVLDSSDLADYVRLVTHMFLHGSWVHLLVNMIVLWSFGRGLEPVMGSFRFVVLYLVTGILAAIGHGLINEPINIPLVGASGAIAGVVGAAAVAAPRLPVIFVIFPMPLWVATVAIVVLHILAIAFNWDPEIAWYAHLVGMGAGALLYPLLRRRAVA